MVALGLLLQVTLASPIETARAHLARGDTAPAVIALRRLASVRDTVTTDRLTALFLLQWIGRSPSQELARDAWIEAGATVNLALARGPAAAILHGAVVVDEGETRVDDELRGRFGAFRWTEGAARLRDRMAEADPALAGAAAWALAQHHLWELRFAFDAQPGEALPPECRALTRLPRPASAPPPTCVTRDQPPPGASAAEIAKRAGGLEPALRENLQAARRAPWPYNEMAARVRVAFEAMRRDANGLDSAARDTAGLTDHAAREIRVVAFEMSGRRHAAARELAADSAWFARLDRNRAALGPSRLADDVFWHAAWPLLLEPYNARLVAHRARLLLADLVRRAGPPDGLGAFGGVGNPAMLVRIGVPVALGHVSGVNVVFVRPDLHETLVRTGDPDRLPSLDLALAARDDQAAVRGLSGYVALDYDRLMTLEHQVFQYVRAGQRVVDFYAARPVTAPCEHPAARVGLFFLDQGLRAHHQTVDVPDSSQYLMRFTRALADGVHVYSLEYLDRRCRVAARARYVLTVGGPGRAEISDLALADEVPAASAQRVPGEPAMRARPGLTVYADRPVHLYWELYGLDDQGGRRLSILLDVVNVAKQRVPVSGLSRLNAVARSATGGTLSYEVEVPPGQGPVAFGLSVTLNPEASGVHLARLTVRDQTGREVRAERPFAVVPRG